MKNKIIILIFSLFFINCESNSSYPWILDQSYNEILKSAGDKLVLLDFETDW